jgi:hypothetical protein
MERLTRARAADEQPEAAGAGHHEGEQDHPFEASGERSGWVSAERSHGPFEPCSGDDQATAESQPQVKLSGDGCPPGVGALASQV